MAAAKKVKKQPLLLVVVGQPNTGKSWITAELLDVALKKNGIVFSNNWHGAGKVIAPGPNIKANEQLMVSTYMQSVNRLFVIDDSRQWLKSPYNPAAEMYFLLAEQRARNIDFVFIVHSWKQIPTFLVDYNMILMMTPTGVRGLAEFTEHTGNAQEILTARKTVLNRAKKERYPYIFVQVKNG